MGKKRRGNLQTAAYTDDRVGKEQNPEVSKYEKGTQKLVSFSLLFCKGQGEKKESQKLINSQ